MEQQHQSFNEREEAVRRHQAAMQEFGDFDPQIDAVDDVVFGTLAEQIEAGEIEADEAQLVYEAWVKIFYYRRG